MSKEFCPCASCCSDSRNSAFHKNVLLRLNAKDQIHDRRLFRGATRRDVKQSRNMTSPLSQSKSSPIRSISN